jgi:hypothetical protein
LRLQQWLQTPLLQAQPSGSPEQAISMQSLQAMLWKRLHQWLHERLWLRLGSRGYERSSRRRHSAGPDGRSLGVSSERQGHQGQHRSLVETHRSDDENQSACLNEMRQAVFIWRGSSSK